MPSKRPETCEPTERLPQGTVVTDYLIEAYNTGDPARIARALWITALSMGWHDFTARVGTPRMFLVPAFMKGADIPFETVALVMRRLGVVLTPHVNLHPLKPNRKLSFNIAWSEVDQRYLSTCDQIADLQHADIDPVTALNGLLLQVRKRYSV